MDWTTLGIIAIAVVRAVVIAATIAEDAREAASRALPPSAVVAD